MCWVPGSADAALVTILCICSGIGVDRPGAVQVDGAPGAFGEGGGGGGGSKVHPDREPASPAAGAAVATPGRARPSGRGRPPPSFPSSPSSVLPAPPGSLAADIAHFITTYGGDTSGCPDSRGPARAGRAGRGGSDRATPTRSLVLVASAFDFSDHKAAAYAPQMTLDMYLAFPEDASKLIEVVDGWIVRCESAEPSHQAIQLNLLIAIRDAARIRDRAKQSCHRVLGDMDVLIADSPKLHFRRPDVVIYRCIDDDRGRWGRKPIAADCLIAVEIVSADSITTDIRDKRAEYAAAGIPHYWIVRMTDNDGPAISVERLLLTSDGEYTREGLAIRGRDFHAIDTISPFPLRLTWEALDEGV
jgi:Uma2 family endonuclease